ncbi:HAD family hydrolase [Angustibacter sp. McL0619]|uniref:HAD family hydrolase n=1 Tax=Angustibacter sp. McL0619 TaxID=3415676 RepID=UPI003CEF54F1
MSAVLGDLVDGVLLDIDDTLVDTHASFAAGMGAVAEHYLPHLHEHGPRRALDHWFEDRGGYYDRYAAGELGFLQQRRLRADALLSDLGGTSLDDESFLEWNAVYERAFTASWVAMPGAVELVDALNAANVPLGAVTNHESAYQREKLIRCGLGGLPVLVGVDTLHLAKPDARVFQHACELAGLAPGRTVYVGNDLQVDAIGARDAGLHAVWLDRGLDHRGRAGVTPATSRAFAAGVRTARSLAEVARWLGLAGVADLGEGTTGR